MRKRPDIPRIDGGAQTVLLVADVERSVEFYGGKLLLERRDGDAGRYAEYETGEGGTLVLVRQDGSIAPMASPAAADRAATLAFTIALDDYETWKKWLARKGVAMERETRWIHGGRSMFVRDPDGRRIEFKTPPAAEVPKPVVLQERKPAD